MQVFANLCEPHSFMRSIMKAGETYNIAACNFFNGFSLNTSLLKKAFPNNPITVPVSSHSVFAKIYIDYISMHASYPMDGDHRKLLEVCNGSGTLLFSLGFKSNPYNPWGPSDGDRQPLAVYTWNEDGSLKTTKVELGGFNPLALYTDYSNRSPNRALAYYYYNDPNDLANTKLDIYYGDDILLTLAGTDFGDQTDRDPAKLYFFRNTLNLESGSSYHHRIGYIVVTDTLDLSLEPVVMKPSVLTYSESFTGSVSDLREPFQDEKFVSCSAETGKYIEFTIDKSVGSYSRLIVDGGLISGSMYFYGRYLQIGGSAVTFSISIYNGAELYHTEDIVVPANEDSAYYQTKVSTTIGNVLAGLKSNQFKSFTVRISLKEV